MYLRLAVSVEEEKAGCLEREALESIEHAPFSEPDGLVSAPCKYSGEGLRIHILTQRDTSILKSLLQARNSGVCFTMTVLAPDESGDTSAPR